VRYLKKISLPLAVFTTGACVLIIEVAATRVLSPYFGNTIFTVSGVIGVVLAALSAGYYFGGKLADKYPEEKFFYFIILLSGFSVILLHSLTRFLLPSIGYSLSIVSGPVISALILFFAPSFLLGTLSPFAVKLQEQYYPDKGIGSIAGEIFFWSTLGSIFGSLFAGFVLIPRFGVSRIVLAVAVVLIVLGFFPLMKTGIAKNKYFKAIISGAAGILLLGALFSFEAVGAVYSHDGIYEKITIYDGEYAGRPTRFFQQDHSSSGAMFFDSDELVLDYTKYYVLYKVFKSDVKNALVIGGGAYSIPKALLKDLPEASVDVSEIEPSLFGLAQKYFNVAESERLNNYTDDGRRLLYDTAKKYDLIFSDVYYSLYSIPAHFTTREFFEIAKEKLNKDGVFIANLIGNLSRQEPSFIMSEIKTFQTVFSNSYFFAVDAPGSTGMQNIIFVGYNSDKKIDFNDPRILNDENPVIKSLVKKVVNMDRFEFSRHAVLTDDFSPVEYLTAKVIQKSYGHQNFTDGDEMLAIIDQQLRYGPRYLSAAGHKKIRNFLTAEIETLAEETKLQTWTHMSPDGQVQELTNIIGRFYPDNKKRVILATHYDSKKFADKDAKNNKEPVPGANDSASGVAALLEIARVLAYSGKALGVGVDMIFFDGEEGEESLSGNYADWKPLGSTYFAEHLSEIYGNNKPISGLVLDMVCDKDLEILKEQSSMQNAPGQTEAFWEAAKKVSGDVFRDQTGPEIRDDHTPLNKAGIPSSLIIDFEYSPFHTAGDTLDKCSAKSLETVASAVLSYIYSLK
jgi:spermidine synthase